MNTNDLAHGRPPQLSRLSRDGPQWDGIKIAAEWSLCALESPIYLVDKFQTPLRSFWQEMLLDVRNGQISTIQHPHIHSENLSTKCHTSVFPKIHFMGVNEKRKSVASTRKPASKPVAHTKMWASVFYNTIIIKTPNTKPWCYIVPSTIQCKIMTLVPSTKGFACKEKAVARVWHHLPWNRGNFSAAGKRRVNSLLWSKTCRIKLYLCVYKAFERL